MITSPRPRNWMDDMTVTVPEGELDGLRVSRFTITPDDFRNRLEAIKTGRSTRPGTYTELRDRNRLWMTDTDAEKQDHLPALQAIRSWEAHSVLINGLGLGMVLQAALAFKHVRHVDVVEIDKRVIDLVGPHYTTDPRVHLHLADAYEQARRWPPGSYWDVIWSDIWPDLCTDNLDGMTRLRRSYGRRCNWHGCWGRDLLLRQRRARGW